MAFPDTLLMLSGGIDSAYCMWQALSQGRALWVHHVHLYNREGRVEYEALAVQKILQWMRDQGLTNFKYTESSFDYGTLKWVTMDHCIWSLMIGIIMQGRPFHLKRVIRTEHWDSTPDGPESLQMRQAHRRYTNISYEVCERQLIWEHPIQHMKKAEVIRAMPPGLLECCWWCRRPTDEGKPCHRCYTCRLVDAALATNGE